MYINWSQLPNAEHIVRILALSRSHPDQWINMLRAAPDELTYAAWCSAYSTVRGNVLIAALDDVRGTLRRTGMASTHYSAWNAVLALVAYDESAHMLDSSVEDIMLLCALGHPYAILFLPAVIAFAKVNALTKV